MSVGLEAAVSLCVCVNMHYQQAPASFFPSFIGAPRVDGDSLHALGNQTQKIIRIYILTYIFLNVIRMQLYYNTSHNW